MAELLPATGDELHGIDYRVTTQITPGQQEQVTRVESGPRAQIETRLAYWQMQASINTDITGITHDDAEKGRSTLTINFAPAISQSAQGGSEEYGTQELRAYDNEKDIRQAPYFKALKNPEINVVMERWQRHEDAIAEWTDLQKKLYGHISHGVESYIETAYEFTQTFRTTAQKRLNKSSANANTVQPLPDRSPTIEKLIDSLPAGEWLKKPTQVTYLGNHGWLVTLTFVWALNWSVIYGGTFTGLDP